MIDSKILLNYYPIIIFKGESNTYLWMTSESNINYRKIVRNFKGRIELMKKTDPKKIESIFLELYELGLQDYIQKEKEKYPNKTHKEIIISMYEFHDRLRGRKK